MIMICERCCGVVGEGESMVRLAHIDEAHPDGSISWVYSYLHVDGCAEPRVAPHRRPDTGTWDRAWGIPGRGA